MKAQFNFADVEDKDFEPVPEGEYTVNLFDVEQKETRNGDDMYVLILKIAEGDQKGKNLFLNLPVMKTTLWKIKQSLQAFGMEIPKSAVDVDFDNLMGKQCLAVVAEREYNGNIYADVKQLKKLPTTTAATTNKAAVPF